MNIFKRFIIPVVILVFVFLMGCGSKTDSNKMADEKTFTLEELSKYNGKDGNSAYIAIDGIVYDVTNVRAWNSGDHNGFEAGNDLTTQIKEMSPHGTSKLRGLPVVGKLEE